jgi:Cu/Ag efflux protein CusF
MKKAITITIVILFALTITSVTFAGEENASPTASMDMKVSPAKSDDSNVKSARGEVIAVNTEAQTITIAKKVIGIKEEIVISLDEHTKIKNGTLADIKSGELVRVQYIEADGKNIAKQIKNNIARN